MSSICHSSDSSLKKQWEVEHSPNTSHTKPSCKSEVSLPPNSHLRPCFASAWHVGPCFFCQLGRFQKIFLRYFSKRFESMLDKGLHHVHTYIYIDALHMIFCWLSLTPTPVAKPFAVAWDFVTCHQIPTLKPSYLTCQPYPALHQLHTPFKWQ